MIPAGPFRFGLAAALLISLSMVGCAGTAPSTIPSPAAGAPEWDLLLTGGRLVDGSGNPWRHADVAVQGDRIVRVAPPGVLAADNARDHMDVTGLVVAPGFIDLNGHSDLVYLSDGSALSKIFQGVTTEIMGESTTPAPVNELILEAVDPGDTTAVRRASEWTRFDGWLRAMEASGVAVNVGSFVGGTTVRAFAMGSAEGEPGEAQLDTMRAVTRRAM